MASSSLSVSACLMTFLLSVPFEKRKSVLRKQKKKKFKKKFASEQLTITINSKSKLNVPTETEAGPLLCPGDAVADAAEGEEDEAPSVAAAATTITLVRGGCTVASYEGLRDRERPNV